MAVERRGTPNTTLINVSGFALRLTLRRKIDLIRSSTRQTEKLASAVTKGPVLAAPVGPYCPLVGCTGCLGQSNINTVTIAVAAPSECPPSDGMWLLRDSADGPGVCLDTFQQAGDARRPWGGVRIPSGGKESPLRGSC